MAERRLRAVESPERRERLTIDELARETGMTVRNIRNHQSRGLLPPPEVIARKGYYGREHVERLRLIREMQADGFNLEAIRRLLSDAGGADQILGFKRVVNAPPHAEPPEILSEDELVERFGPLDAENLAKAAKLEFLVPIGEGRYEAPSPALLRGAEEALRSGISMAAALDVVAQVKRSCEAISRAFVKLFLDELWKPVRSTDDPQASWPEVVDAVERLRPVASETVLALFTQTLATAIESAFAAELERQARRGR